MRATQTTGHALSPARACPEPSEAGEPHGPAQVAGASADDVFCPRAGLRRLASAPSCDEMVRILIPERP